jgi:hypothetical protein
MPPGWSSIKKDVDMSWVWTRPGLTLTQPLEQTEMVLCGSSNRLLRLEHRNF